MHLARPRLILALVLVMGQPACADTISAPEGAWRDQFIFVSDDGTVLSLGVHRQTSGSAEAKVWLGRGDSWESDFYKTFSIERERAPSLSATLDRLSRAPVINVDRDESSLRIRLRTPDRRVEMAADEMLALGKTADPEGTTVYSAGRVSGRDNDAQLTGWLIAEETPSADPHRPLVDYGEFVFLVLASDANGVLIAKRSLNQPEFDHAFTLDTASPLHTRDVVIDVEAETLAVELEQLGRSDRYRIVDRNTSRGVGPQGEQLVYETLFLSGADAGVAFVIRPEKESER